jgi:hypothetical protein
MRSIAGYPRSCGTRSIDTNKRLGWASRGEEVVVSIEGGSAFVLGIDDRRHRGSLARMGQAALQRVQKYTPIEALGLGGLIDCQPA